MALTIVSRTAAGLSPVPGSIGHRSLSSWTGIKVHHTGGAFSSWLAIHEWQTAGRPEGQRLAYAGYSFGVADGRVTQLRGWDHQPAHDHENSTLGVVFGGNYASSLPPEEDLAAFVEFARLARTKTGRALPVTGHRDTWPRGDWRYSSCPGDRLYAELPYLRRRIDEEDDMPSAQEIAKATVDRLLGTTVTSRVTGREVPLGRTILNGGYEQSYRGRELAAANQSALAELAGQVAGLAELVREALATGGAPLTEEQLRRVEAAARAPGERIAAALAEAGQELADLAEQDPA